MPHAIAVYLPPPQNEVVRWHMYRLGKTFERLGCQVSFVDMPGDGKAIFRGKCRPDEVDFGIYVNRNFPFVGDPIASHPVTGERVRELAIGSYPLLGLLTLPYYFDAAYLGATLDQLRGIFCYDKASYIGVLTSGILHAGEFISFYHPINPAPPETPRRKLLYVANMKGFQAVNRIFLRFPSVASRSRKALALLKEDFSLSVPAIVSGVLGMEYREWVQYKEWRSYAEELQKCATYYDRLSSIEASSSFPCHYVMNRIVASEFGFHPDSTFSEPVKYSHVLSLYRDYGAIVANLPSRMPNVLSERVTDAMVCGAIPIVPCKGEHMALLDSTNAIFYRERVASIREAISTFFDLNDSQRLTMSRNAYATAMERFPPEAFAVRIVAAYEKIRDKLQT